MTYEEQYAAYCDRIEAALVSVFSCDPVPQVKLRQAMKYSLLGGGKRIRPVLVLEFCRISGMDPVHAMPLACAVEMMHTYSLIHDDLPCMDDDKLRRGRPTCHIVFGETAAVLAGDALQAQAFSCILSSDLPSAVRLESARILAEAVGEQGMCGGQILDMESEAENITEDALITIHSKKTSALIEAACMLGAVCGHADAQQLAAAREYAAKMGLAFQIRDDMLDVIGSSKETGKTIGSDWRDGKTTFMTLYGEDICKARVAQLTQEAKACIQQVFDDHTFLCNLADALAIRNK